MNGVVVQKLIHIKFIKPAEQRQEERKNNLMSGRAHRGPTVRVQGNRNVKFNLFA